MEFNTKLSKLIARRKVIETRKRLNKIVQSPYNGLNVLYNFDVIKATTRKSVYVINHNIIFKGSIGDFIKEYNKYYENIDVIVNDKGKFVLE